MDIRSDKVLCTAEYKNRVVRVAGSDAASVTQGDLTPNAVDYFVTEYAQRCTDHATEIAVFPPEFYATLVANRPQPIVAGFPAAVCEGLESCNFTALQSPQYTSVFRNDVVFIPLRTNDHWVLAAICVFCNPRQRRTAGPQAAVFVFDSRKSLLHPSSEVIATDLRAFLNCVWYFAEHTVHRRSMITFTEDTCPLVSVRVGVVDPVQDCGVHVVKTAKALLGSEPGFFADAVSHRSDLVACALMFPDGINVTPDDREQLVRALRTAAAVRRGK